MDTNRTSMTAANGEKMATKRKKGKKGGRKQTRTLTWASRLFPVLVLPFLPLFLCKLDFVFCFLLFFLLLLDCWVSFSFFLIATFPFSLTRSLLFFYI